MQEKHTNRIESITFSPDGKMVASAGIDKVIRLWDVYTGKCLKILCGHTGWIRSVIFTTDGNFLASGSDDGTIKIWDSNTGECIKTLSNKPYADMNITAIKGLTETEIASLKALGAVENNQNQNNLT